MDRFWSRVDIRGEDECWPWLGSFTHNGYGRFWFEGKTVRANRFSYQDQKGPIGDDDVIRHSCDNPPCCNPKHLLRGTQKDNIDDRQNRDRGAKPKGAKNAMAKMTDEKIMALRRLVASGEGQEAAGKQFGLTQTTVSDTVRGNLWPHLPILGHSSKPGPIKRQPPCPAPSMAPSAEPPPGS